MATSTLPSENSVNPKQRWEILKGAVLKHPREVVYGHRTASVRSFEGFSLYKKKFILSPLAKYWSSSNTDLDNLPGKWYVFTPTQEKHSQMTVKIKLLTGAVPKKDLIGFDNTGNICLWPAEEVLAYLVMKLDRELEGLSICELGGGMTGFAGVTAALTKRPKLVLISDGNQMSIDNSRVIVNGNCEHFGETSVLCDEIRWGDYETYSRHEGQFDLVIAADCLFFDCLHLELIKTICDLLKEGGKAILLAPRRGKTLGNFSEIASKHCRIIIEERYDDLLWEKHLMMTERYPNSYVMDLHYPILVTLFK